MYREMTRSAHVYDFISSMEVGEKKVLEPYVDAFGVRSRVQCTRLTISRVCAKHGFKVFTRRENGNLVLCRVR